MSPSTTTTSKADLPVRTLEILWTNKTFFNLEPFLSYFFFKFKFESYVTMDIKSVLPFLSGRCKKASRGLQGGAIREEESPRGCQNLCV